MRGTKIKKIAALLMTGVLAMPLGVYGSENDAAKDLTVQDYVDMDADEIVSWTPKNELVHKVGLIIPDTTTEFYNEIMMDAQKMFEEAGYECVAEGINGDSAKGVTVIESWLAGGIDAIVIMAQDRTCDDALKKAMEEGVLVVSASAKIKYYHHWLMQDNYEVGYEVADMASKWMKEQGWEEGEYITISNNTTEATADKSRGVLEGMKELLPDATCVGEVVMTSVDQVRADVDTLLMQYPDVCCVAAMHNAFSLIGMEAAKAAGKDASNFGVFGASLAEQVISELHKEDSMYVGEVWMGDQARNFVEHTIGLLEGKSYPHDWAALNFPLTRENIDTYYDDYYAEMEALEQ